MNARKASLCCLLLLAAGLATGTTESEDQCPFVYERHTLDQVVSGERTPWLFDGVFHAKDRLCVNCQRGSLWPTWCGRRKTKLDYWDLQQCEERIANLATSIIAEHRDIQGALLMTPCDLFKLIKGRTLWIIGDSMSKDLIKAFKCFMIEFWDLNQYHVTNNFSAMHHLHSLPGHGEPHCIHMAAYTRMCQVHAIQGDLFVNTTRAASGVLPLLLSSHLALKDDIVILNFGLWHGDVVRDRYIQHLHELGAFYLENRERLPWMFFMETPKQHFARSRDGDFQVAWLRERDKVVTNHTCGPVANVSYEADGNLRAEEGDEVARAVANGTWRNIDARRVLRDEYGMGLVPVYNATVALWEMHRSNSAGKECSHYCHPSAPQIWLYILQQTLLSHGVQPLPFPKGPVRERNACAQVFEKDQGKLGAPKPVDRVMAEAKEREERERRQRRPFFRYMTTFLSGRR